MNYTLLLSALGAVLRKLRLQKDVLQKDVCEAVGISPASYNQFEKGGRMPKFADLVNLAEYYDLQVHELLAMVENPNLVSKIQLQEKHILELTIEVDSLKEWIRLFTQD